MDIEINCSRCTSEVNRRNHLEVLLEGVDIDELIEAVGRDELLDAIGEDEAIKYFGIEVAE